MRVLKSNGLAVVLMLWTAISAWAQPYGLTNRSAVGPFLNGQLPPATQTLDGWEVVEAFPNLTFDDPVCLLAEPGTNRLYVCERQGKVYFFENDPATTAKTLFIDLSPVTQGYDDCGLLGLAFHPDWRDTNSPNRGYVYIYYQFSEEPTSGPNRPPSATPGFNRLSRFTVPDGVLVADRGSELVLINQFDRHVWHNGGGLFFGPDGFLYLSNGDEGAANDSYNQSQEIDSGLFSGVLRIDVDMDPSRSHPIRRQPQHDQAPPAGWTNQTTYSDHYYIPNDNPWLDTNGTLLEEFYAVGLRSPHRMTYDPPTDQIWVGDIGQGTREEIDLIVKGGNYQWAYREGSFSGPKSMPNPLIGIDTPPVYDYGRSAGDTCVIGGYVYRGTEFADALYGKYIFGDNTSGRIWAMTYDGVSPPTVVELLDTGWPNNYAGLSSFGIDNNHELFICKMGRPSKIYKLARTGPQPPSPPTRLSQVGAFTDLATLTPVSELIPYDVNSPLWSDGAAKFRWAIIPNDGAPFDADEVVQFAPTGEWTFPVGTVFVKHFELGINTTNPAMVKRLETRFLVHATNNTWYGLTYKWRPDHSDADLLPGGLLEPIPIQTASTVVTQTWQYPSRQDCLTCHNETANRVLGVKTRQLNGDFLYPSSGVTDNQLRAWNHLSLFDTALNEADLPTYDALVAVTNTPSSVELRVRSYLDANCGHCHRPNGVAALFDARFDTPLPQQGLINGPVVDPMGVPGAKIVAPQSPIHSMLYLRDNTVGVAQMPPLARNVIDTNYIDVLTQWINSLPLAAPSNLVATAFSVSSIRLSWDDSVSGGLGFLIERSHDGSNFDVIATNGAGVLQYTDAGLLSGTTHHYRVQTYSGTAISPYSETVQATTPTSGVSGFVQSTGSDALVVMEIEHFDSNTPANGKAWETNLTAGYAGTAALQALPNTGVNQNTGYAVNSPRLDFTVNFSAGGTHYIWVRGIGLTGSDDSCHVGLDGAEISTSDRISSFNTAWAWSKTTMDSSADATFVVASPGEHTLNVWMREDGFIIDKLLLTTNPAYAPTGFGPAESPRGSAQTPPWISDIDNLALNEDTSSGPVSFFIGDLETAPDNLLVSVDSSNTNLIRPADIALGGSGTNRSLTFTPLPNQSGVSTITVSVSDGATNTQDTFGVTVIAVNDPPSVSSIPDQTINQGSTTGPLPFVVQDAETDPSSLLLHTQSSNTGLVPTNNVALSGSSSNRTVTVTPEPAASGETIITLIAADEETNSSTSFVLTVLPFNSPPVPTQDTVTRWLGDSAKVRIATLLANDTDINGDTLTLLSAGPASAGGGSVTIRGEWVHYTPPDPNYGQDTFAYTITDGQGGIATNGWVMVEIADDTSMSLNVLTVDQGDGTVLVRARGVPGRSYAIQYANTQQNPTWQTLTTLQTDPTGALDYIDTPPTNAPTRYYRTAPP